MEISERPVCPRFIPKSESIWHPSAIPWQAILCTVYPASLWKISPASRATEDISCTPAF
jgi:hypothetical protein